MTSTGNTAWTITNNRLFQTATRVYTTTNTHNGINIQTGAGYTITGNTIGYANSAGTGTTNIVGNSVALAGFPASYTTTGTANATRYQAMNLTFTAAGTNSTIDNNTIAGFALYTSSGAGTTTGIFCGICVAAGNATIGGTGNTIGTPTASIYTANTSSGGAISAIYATSANTVSILNNTIQNLDAMGTTALLSGSIKGIETAGTSSTAITITGNTVGNATNPNLRMGNLTTGANLSNVGTTFGVATGTGLFQGILNNSSSAAVVIGTAASGNTVRNASLNSSSSIANARGIISQAGVNSIVNNSVSNLTTVSTSISTTTTASVAGIVQPGSVAGQTISRNTVQNLSNATTTATAIVVNGIITSNSSNSATTNIIERNLVQNNTTTSTGAAVLNGIFTFNGGATYRNNMVLLGAGSTLGTTIINGMRSDTTAAAINNFYNNSVFISGTGVTTGTAATNGFIRITTDTTDFRNNIIVNNRSNGTGTGKHYAMNLNALTTVTLNYNLYFENGTGAVFGVIAAADDRILLPTWQTALPRFRKQTVRLPIRLFVSATNLHINRRFARARYGRGHRIGNERL